MDEETTMLTMLTMPQKKWARELRASALTAMGLILLVSVQVPEARADFSDWSLGPHVGWVRETETDENGFTLGVATRLKLMEILAGELAVDWRTQDIEAGEVKTIPVQLSGLIYVVPDLFHGTVGVGWYQVDASLEGVGDTISDFDDSTSDFGMHLGAGLEIPIASRTSLTAEGRYVWLGYELEEAGEAIQVDGDFLNVMAGLQFQVW
jgi:hypothetical protein